MALGAFEKRMVIVVVHWKIRPNKESLRQFLLHWKDVLALNERDHLVGEYLSRPLTTIETGFACCLLDAPASPSYHSYFNVGLWADLGSFKRQVIDQHVATKVKPEPFEYEPRSRMVLSPLSWRTGDLHTSSLDHFEIND